ncbi:MAG: choice-of-anchor L domain-containing protein [Lewinellaceae bacterium]|nr:choice-of-anchor L domain-containing protein [Lewinellaceae bacterium]
MRIFFTSIPLGIAFVLSFAPNRLFAQNIILEDANPETVILDGLLQRQVMRVGNPVQIVAIQHLFPGETYLLKIPKNPVSDMCLPAMQLLIPGDQVLSYNDTLHEIRFKADAETMEFVFEYACSWDTANPPTHYISLLCQTCQKKTLREYMESSAGEIMVEPGINAHTLVRDVLIGGNCFDVSNVTYSGQPSQIGTFSNGISNIGFSEGIVMATGNAQVTTGINSTDNADMGFAIYTPDSDLSELSAGGDTYDMANIEFDFRPTQSSVAFEFVFASEEYCEYVNSEFNDAFGFFISGPGINGPFNGAENIALVPTTPTFVAINNVNHLLNSAYFTNNTPPTGILCGQTGVNTPAVNQIQFDGFTKKITARANLQTCKTYRIS